MGSRPAIPRREQSTLGDVSITSSNNRGHYFIRLRGPRAALEWLLPNDHIPGKGPIQEGSQAGS